MEPHGVEAKYRLMPVANASACRMLDGIVRRAITCEETLTLHSSICYDGARFPGFARKSVFVPLV